MNTTSVEITAGLGGFLVVFGLALAVWILGRDLTRRLRRMGRAEEQRLAAERSARAAEVRERGGADGVEHGRAEGVPGAGTGPGTERSVEPDEPPEMDQREGRAPLA